MNPVSWPEQARQYLSEVEIEFKKVTWPTRKETIAGTIGTCVVVLVVCIGLFGVDAVIGRVMEVLERMVRG
ncbi:MAG: preprotein translocase subunit SecE [Planctomycetota bacterium]